MRFQRRTGAEAINSTATVMTVSTAMSLGDVVSAYIAVKTRLRITIAPKPASAATRGEAPFLRGGVTTR